MYIYWMAGLMAHTDSPARAGSPEPHLLDGWLSDGQRRRSAGAVANQTWQQRCEELVFEHIEVSLQRIRRGKRIQGWLAVATAGTALMGCNGLTLLSFGTALAADPGGIPLRFGLPHSVGRFLPVLVATLPAYVFIRLHKLASAYVSARERELREYEGIYLTFASGMALASEDLIKQAIEALRVGAQGGSGPTGEISLSGLLTTLAARCVHVWSKTPPRSGGNRSPDSDPLSA